MALAVKLQPDGKILVGGLASHPPFDDDFGLARYNSDGSPDSDFGVGGKVTTDFGGEHDGVNSLLLLPGGKIVAVGVSWSEGHEDDFALACYNSDGSLDTSFGVGGKVITDLGRNVDDIGIGSVLADGKIVVAGSTNSTLFDSGRSRPDVFGEGDFAVARYDLNGGLDPSFGNGGIVVTDIFGEDIAVTVAAQPDGKIIAAGTKSSLSQDFALVRYNSNGTLDGSFGSGGKVSTDLSGHDIAFSLILQPNGKIVATGVTGLTEIPVGTDGELPEIPHAQFGLARYNVNGSLDTTFGVNGTLMTDFAGLNGFACTSVQQNDGKLVVGGTAYISDTDSVFALARYTLRSKQAIAFTSNRDGNSEVYIMNPDGTNQTRLTNNFADDTQPSLSSDGTRIAFMSTRDGNEEIYVMNADGSGQTRLTNGVFSDRYPAFSYDGTRIVFSSFRDGNQEIYVMNADGSGQTRLTDNVATDDQPTFSPDGSGIVFESWRDQNCELYLMNSTGGGLTRLTFVAPFLDEHPVFSPNGSKVAFFSGRDGYPEIYIMNPDGSAAGQADDSDI
ncbi:MAG: PD40 domain-containing protein [Acidobacteria bacterium]|nr:PD40 domain-containing protein [Acidobacteriota bacterium]